MMSISKARIIIPGAARLLLLGAALLVCAPLIGQAVKGGSSPLDALVFASKQLRVTVTLADADAIQGVIANATAITAFKAEQGAAWHFTMDQRAGRVNLMDGGAIPFIPGPANTLQWADFGAACQNISCIPPGQVEALARDFLTRYQKIFAMDPSELVLVPAGSIPIGNSIYLLNFQWVYGGIPVEGGSVYFRINNGNLIQVGMENIGNITLDPAPGLSPDAAWQILDDYVGGLQGDDLVVNPGTLAILPVTPKGMNPEVYAASYGTMLDYALVYRLAFHRPGIMGTWEATVDAHTGELLRFSDANAYGHVQGGVYKMDYPFTETTVPFPYVDYGASAYCDAMGNYTGTSGTSTMNGRTGGAGSVGGVYITDNCGSSSLASNGSGLVDFGNQGAAGTDCTTPGFGGAGNTHAARTQYWNVMQMKTKAFSYLPGNTWLQGHLQDKVNMTGSCNSYWFYSGFIQFYQSTGNCGNTGEIPGVAYHEWGHGLDQNDGTGTGTQPDNLPVESRADWTAIMQTHASCAGSGWTPGFLCSGYGDTCSNCQGLRDADYAQHQYPYPWTPQNNGLTGATDPHYGCSANSYAGPCGWESHCESGIPSQALWDFVNRDLTGAPTSLDLTTAWQLEDRLFYNGIGTSTSMYSCTVGSPTVSSGCGAGTLYTVLRAIDDDGDGTANGTPHAAAIYAALARHNIACGSAGDATNQNHTSCAGLNTPTTGGTTGDTQNGITWTSAGGNATRYFVFRNETGCNWGFTRIATVTAPTTTYTDTQVYNGVTYYYRIQAATANDSCAGVMSNCVTLTPCVPPGAPVITSITDNNLCAQDGIRVNYTAGSGAASHNLLKDGSVVVTGYASGALYNPGDTNSHTYIVQAVSGSCTTNSAGSAFTDANNTPGAPVITSITDNNPCAQDGIKVHYTAGSGALSHDLYMDGIKVVTAYNSGALYNPGDTNSHAYVVRALNGNCHTDSAAQAAADINLMPGIPTIGTVTVTGPDQLRVSWTAGSPAGAVYNIYRADGSCPGGAYVLVKGIWPASPWIDTSVVGGNSYSYKVTAVDGTGTCESAKSGCAWGTACGPTAAVYNATYKAPACTIVGTSCDTGSSLIHCEGAAEPNSPNTVNGSCPDGGAGACGQSESVEQIAIATNDNLCLAAGEAVTVTAVFHCSGTAGDSLSFYYATKLPGGFGAPTWKALGAVVKCMSAGLTTATRTFTLSGPAGAMQAVRAEIVRAWVPSSPPPACLSGSFNDRDDLVFKIK